MRLARQHRPLATIIAIYVVVFFTLAFRKYSVFGWDSGDIGHFNNILWSTLHGRPYFNSSMQINFLGWHTTLLLSQLLPFYWLFPGVATMLFLQSAFLGISSVPMYLIARKVLNNHVAAVLLAVAFILFPPVVALNVNQFADIPFTIVYLLFAFYFFLEERFAMFILFAFIACLGRENVSLFIAMFGVYGFFLRRSKRWVIAPFGLGTIYFVLAMFVVMPYFRQGNQWHVTGRMFTYLGHTNYEITRNAVTHPELVLQHLFGEENIVFLITLTQPLAWALPFTSLASLIAAPELSLILLSDNSALKVIAWTYSSLTASFLFISSIYGVKRLSGWLEVRYGKQVYVPVIAACLVLLSLNHWYLWFVPQQYRRLPQHDSLVRALEAVPPGKSVLVPTRLQGHVGIREHWHSIMMFVERPAFAAQFEYVVLDANERQFPPIITQELFDRFQKTPNYRLIFAENNVFVFQRLGGESDWKIPPLEKTSTSD